MIAALKSKGVIVTSAQVSMLRPAGANGKGHANGHTNVASELLFDQLLAAKRFAKELGGIGKARQALDALARLV